MRSICFQSPTRIKSSRELNGIDPDVLNNYALFNTLMDMGQSGKLYDYPKQYSQIDISKMLPYQAFTQTPNITPTDNLFNKKDIKTGLEQQIADEPDLYGDISNGLGIANLMTTAANSLNNTAYNLEKSYDNIYDDIAMRGTAEDRTVGNRLREFFLTGNGIWGETSEDKEIRDAVQYHKNQSKDFSSVKNNMNLFNTWGGLQQQITPYSKTDPRQLGAATAINRSINTANQNTLNSFYDTANTNNQRQLRTNMYNIFQQGGYLSEDNGITQFNVGDTHQNNPYGGIQQGIASDGKPNYVEEGEIRYNDYIFSARNKPSDSLLEKYNIV